jgi:hypothetical protein
MQYLGDIAVGQTIRFTFPTYTQQGASVAPSVAGTVRVYKDANTAESTAGVTYTTSFDSVSGQNLVAIDTSADGTFYTAGSDYSVSLHGATVDSQSLNGATLAHFSIQNRTALRPSTPGRTLDVDASGRVRLQATQTGVTIPTVTTITDGVTLADGAITEPKIASGAFTATKFAAGAFDAVWTVASRTLTGFGTLVADIWGAATSGLNVLGSIGKLLVDNINATIGSRSSHSAADVRTEMDTNSNKLDVPVSTRASASTASAIETDTQDIQNRLPAALVNGRMDSYVGAVADAVLTLAKFANDYLTDMRTRMDAALTAYDATVPGDLTPLQSDLDAMQVILDKLNTMLELDGLVYRYTTNALEQAPSGGGASDQWNTSRNTYTDPTKFGGIVNQMAALIAALSASADIRRVTRTVDDDDVVTLSINTDYNVLDLSWTRDTFPSTLTADTPIYFISDVMETITGTVTVLDNGQKRISFNLTAAQTNVAAGEGYNYEVYADVGVRDDVPVLPKNKLIMRKRVVTS